MEFCNMASHDKRNNCTQNGPYFTILGNNTVDVITAFATT